MQGQHVNAEEWSVAVTSRLTTSSGCSLRLLKLLYSDCELMICCSARGSAALRAAFLSLG